jgi:hypothetical protein
MIMTNTLSLTNRSLFFPLQIQEMQLLSSVYLPDIEEAASMAVVETMIKSAKCAKTDKSGPSRSRWF